MKSIIKTYEEFLDRKVNELDTDDKHYALKCFLYGAASAIPEGLAAVGLQVFMIAGINLIRGKGWTVCPKD